MTQTTIVLQMARDEDYVYALNVLTLVKMRMISVTTDNLMMAYLVTTEWCEWFKNPDCEGSPLAGKGIKAQSYASALELMDSIRKDLAEQIEDEVDLITMVFHSLNPNPLTVGKRFDDPNVPDLAKFHYKSLMCTATFFKEQLGNPEFSEILEGC
ncbi:MAG: hypothetical protein Q4D11_06335 [Rhodospirillales bacterium]|nr:hypothetical protein [Rhodospirillales bacterium]